MTGYNVNMMSFFTNVKYENEDTMVQISKDGTKSAGIWNKRDITRWHRDSDVKNANNEIRTKLLQSLGDAFGIKDGIGTDNEGRTTFSKEFMDRLEDILGDDFKRSDFGVSTKGGAVKSGRPLTQRRIAAILKKAETAGNNPEGIAPGKPVNVKKSAPVTGHVPFTVEAYLAKAEAILKPFKGMTEAEKKEKPVYVAVQKAKSALEFLKNNLSNLIEENTFYDAEYLNEEKADPQVTTKYCIQVPRDKLSDPQKKDAKHGGKQLYDFGNPDFVTCKYNKNDVQDLVTEHFGFLLHIVDNAKTKKGQEENDDANVEAIKKYIDRTLSEFARLVINLCEDTAKTPKIAKKLESAFRYHHPCIEGWTSELLAFQSENHLERVDAGEIRINQADHDRNTPLVECMYKEVALIMEGHNEDTPKWSKCREKLIQNLVGLERPLKKGAAPQKITVQDVDNLKGEFMTNLVGEEQD